MVLSFHALRLLCALADRREWLQCRCRDSANCGASYTYTAHLYCGWLATAAAAARVQPLVVVVAPSSQSYRTIAAAVDCSSNNQPPNQKLSHSG